MSTVIYARVSPRPKKKKSKDGKVEESLVDSIAIQLERCRDYAEKNNLETLCEIVDRDVSALSKPIFERLGGKKLKKLIEAGKVENIIILKLDRMFRRVADGDYTMEYFAKKKIQLHSVDEGGTLQTDKSFDFMAVCTRLMIAQFEGMLIGERTRAAMNARVKRGYVTGNPPFGYKLDPDDNEKFVKCPEAQKAIRRILTLHAQKLGCCAIAKQMASEGYLGGSGEAITYKTVSKVLERETVEV